MLVDAIEKENISVFAEYENEGCQWLLQFFVEKFDEFQVGTHVNQELFWADKNEN